MTASTELVVVPSPPRSASLAAASEALDVVVGVSGLAVTSIVAVGRQAAHVGGPVVHLVLHPPVVPAQYQPATWLAALAGRGAVERRTGQRTLAGLLDVVVPAVLAEVLRRIDLTATVRDHVDIDGLVAGVDIDAVAARLDIDAVIDRMDLTALVRERVDVDLIVSTVDLDAAVARVDIDAIAQRLDISAVIDRIDLVGIAEEVIKAIDLPEIIRQSTGSVASETVRGVRMQGVVGDEAIGRAVDRILLRRGKRAERRTELGHSEHPDGPAGQG
jgi:hypothetical protein